MVMVYRSNFGVFLCMRNYFKWNETQINYLKIWFPHFGSIPLSKELGICKSKIRSKAGKLKIQLLPKDRRLCYDCKINYQIRKTIRCRKCFSLFRKKRRDISNRKFAEKMSFEQYVGSVVVKEALKRLGGDIDKKYMLDLWEKQEGKCFYSGIPMVKRKYKEKRGPFSASIDRIDSNKGYFIGNVVWSTWICNVGKNNFTCEEYLNLCCLINKRFENTSLEDKLKDLIEN